MEREKRYVRGNNFITPNKIETINIGNYIIELSDGKDIFDSSKLMFGVTVADYDNKEILHKKCKCFYEREEAEMYINQIKGEV